MIKLPDITPSKIAIKVKPSTEILIKKGHPWVFDNSIVKQNKKGKSGDLAIIFDHKKNKFLACGFYDPHSPIRIKILQVHTQAIIDTTWFTKKINDAYLKRVPLLQTNTNSYRFIYGENDGLPALVADVYNNILVIKLYASFWFFYLNKLLQELIKVSKTSTTVLRLSRNVQKEKNEFNLTDGQVLEGELTNEVVIFKEHGVNFSANVIHGHKTGYFLDHRANRKKVGEMAKGRTVLDVFSYAGGFSVHALVGGAKMVTSLDISQPALEIAKQNAKLNKFKGKHLTIAGDAFEELQKLTQKKATFNLVIIDPPSFAKSANEIPKAITSYKKLASLGVKLTAKKGILVLASCSSRITANLFFETVEEVLTKNNTSYHVLEKTLHDIDHPISFPEGAYLKTIYIEIN